MLLNIKQKKDLFLRVSKIEWELNSYCCDTKKSEKCRTLFIFIYSLAFIDDSLLSIYKNTVNYYKNHVCNSP